jgi:hypothetical protein
MKFPLQNKIKSRNITKIATSNSKNIMLTLTLTRAQILNLLRELNTISILNGDEEYPFNPKAHFGQTTIQLIVHFAERNQIVLKDTHEERIITAQEIEQIIQYLSAILPNRSPILLSQNYWNTNGCN